MNSNIIGLRVSFKRVEYLVEESVKIVTSWVGKDVI